MNEYLVFFVLLEDLFFIDYEPYLTDHISDYHCVYVPLCQFHYISRSSRPLQNTADLDNMILFYTILFA